MNATLQYALDRLQAVHARAGFEFRQRPGATAERLGSLEAELGWQLPKALVALWQLSDGGDGGTWFFPGASRPQDPLGEPYTFLSVESAMRQRRERLAVVEQLGQFPGAFQEALAGLRSPLEPIREVRPPEIQPGVLMHPGWLPFARMPGGLLMLMVDLAPTSQGKFGQVLCLHEEGVLYAAADIESLVGQTVENLTRMQRESPAQLKEYLQYCEEHREWSREPE